jgi:hypothetical protein
MRNKKLMIAVIGALTLGLMLIGSVLRDALLQQPDANMSSATELARIHGWNGFARTANSVTQPFDVSGMALAILVMALLVPMTIVVLRKARRLNARQLAYASGGITIGLLALLIVSGATSKAVMALSSYGSHVPNYGVSLAVNPAGAHCNTCHDPSGSPSIGTVTAFGDTFAAGGYVWTPDCLDCISGRRGS